MPEACAGPRPKSGRKLGFRRSSEARQGHGAARNLLGPPRAPGRPDSQPGRETSSKLRCTPHSRVHSFTLCARHCSGLWDPTGSDILGERGSQLTSWSVEVLRSTWMLPGPQENLLSRPRDSASEGGVPQHHQGKGLPWGSSEPPPLSLREAPSIPCSPAWVGTLLRMREDDRSRLRRNSPKWHRRGIWPIPQDTGDPPALPRPQHHGLHTPPDRTQVPPGRPWMNILGLL